MSESKEVLIVDKMHEGIVPLLTSAGFKARYEPTISRAEVLQQVTKAVGLIIRSKTVVDQELIDAGSNLKFVARAGAGMDQLDVDYIEKKKIHILNAPEGNRSAVGEHALGLLLGLLHKIVASNAEVKDSVWKREENRGVELKGKTVGIYGFGNAGQSFAKKLSGLECRVIAYDKFKKGFADDRVEEVDLEKFRQNVEILSIHVPLNNDTRNFFSRDELSQYPKLKIILNTARGEILNIESVVEMLKNGVLWGVGLDVLPKEKFDSMDDSEKRTFRELASYKNTILTPHVAGWTQESYERINQVLVKKIRGLELF